MTTLSTDNLYSIVVWTVMLMALPLFVIAFVLSVIVMSPILILDVLIERHQRRLHARNLTRSARNLT